ncbi:hypothetical protein AABB24_030435, partial [Solanum stoloniferum]
AKLYGRPLCFPRTAKKLAVIPAPPYGEAVIDSRRNHVYIATGNLYSVPKRIEDCQKEQNQQNNTDPTQPDKCIELDNHSDSILALDMDSGEIEWYKQLGGFDVWFVACMNSKNPNCPIGPSLDYDFEEAPMMLSVVVNGREKVDVVEVVQKSGIAWALKRDNGKLLWTTVSEKQFFISSA